MRTKVSVALNRIELHSIDPTIVVRGVPEDKLNINISTGEKGNDSGQFINGIKKQFREVSVRFAINERTDLNKRMAILQDVAAWAANGGELTVSYREQQRLRVVCAQLPDLGDIRDWTREYEIIFRAYRVPFWESTVKTMAEITAGTSGSATIRLRESGGGKLCAIAANASTSTGAQWIQISANGNTIKVMDHPGKNRQVVFDYDENDIQRIREVTAGVYSSVLPSRTADSADAIILKHGENTITVSSDIAISWEIYCYGRWE